MTMTIYDILPKPIAWAFMAIVYIVDFLIWYRWIIAVVLIVFLVIYIRKKDKRKKKP